MKKKIFSKTIYLLLLLLVPILFFRVLAAPPDSKYLPGETLDPNCSPGDPNCDVGLTTGSVLFANSSFLFSQDNTNLYWDDSNNYLGIGTNSPSSTLDVSGNANISGDLTVDTNTFYLDSSTHRVGIGTTTPAYTLDVNGTFRVSGNTTLATTTIDNLTLTTPLDISDNTNLTVSATGLELSGDSIALTSGYTIPLSASTTNWESFYQTPSNRITAGTGLSWSDNTLNVDDIFLLNTGDTATGDYTFEVALHIGASSPVSITQSNGSLFVSKDLEVGETAYLGPMEFSENSGVVSWIDMPVTSSASAGTQESYIARIDGTNILTVYSESDGAGGIQNYAVGIATSTPEALLGIGVVSGRDYLIVGDTASPEFIIKNTGLVGIGTTSPTEKLTITLDDSSTSTMVL